MKTIELKSKSRKITGKKVKQLREKGIIPAVLYGYDTKPENLMIDLKEFKHVFSEAGSSSVVDLKTDDKSVIKVLIHEPQLHPVTDTPLHVDLYKINMKEKLTTEIPLEFVGESPAVKDLEGNLITNKDNVEVECLPSDLIPKIDVDISVLKTFDDLIHIKDLQVPETITILDDAEEIIAQVTPPRSEEELEKMEEEAVADAEKAGITQIENAADADKAAKEAKKTTEEEAITKTEEKPAEKTEK